MQKRQLIYIASDHAGVELKKKICLHFQANPSVTIVDLGPETDATVSVDYPDYAQKLCARVMSSDEALGVLICGSGVGMSIAANRYKGIRAALVFNEAMAKLSKQHNNANVLCLGARFLDSKTALQILEVWLHSEFTGERHTNRVKKLESLG